MAPAQGWHAQIEKCNQFFNNFCSLCLHCSTAIIALLLSLYHTIFADIYIILCISMAFVICLQAGSLYSSQNQSPRRGSNPRPYAYEAHALPAELRRQMLIVSSIDSSAMLWVNTYCDNHRNMVARIALWFCLLFNFKCPSDSTHCHFLLSLSAMFLSSLQLK